MVVDEVNEDQKGKIHNLNFELPCGRKSSGEQLRQ